MVRFGLGKLNRTMAEFYYNITTSIAFYPVIITLFYLGLVIGMLNFDYSKLATELSEEMRWLRFKEMETIRAILTTLIAGIISLMAFSFSMVMVVLNQTTTTISPKVMQGLISRKEHQFVLGNQFGSLVYFMVLLLLLRGFDYYRIPTFSVSLGLFLGFWSLGLFVYFIHSISRSIQITNVVASLYRSTAQILKAKLENPENRTAIPAPVIETPYAFVTDKPGYLQEINMGALLRTAQKSDLVLRIEPEFSAFVATGCILFRANKKPSELSAAVKKSIYESIIFYNYERIHTNFRYGFTQLSEVAVKSLSPGINDPGIAVICLQYLSDLFVNFYPLEEKNIFEDDSGTVRVTLNFTSFEALFNRTILPIRHYGKNDWLVALALLDLFLVLGYADHERRKFQTFLNQHASAVISSIQPILQVPEDLKALSGIITKMNNLESHYFTLKQIQIPEKEAAKL